MAFPSRPNTAANSPSTYESPTAETVGFENGILALRIHTGVTLVNFETLAWRGGVGEPSQTVSRSTSPTTTDLHELREFPSAIDCYSAKDKPEQCLHFLHNMPEALTMRMYIQIQRLHDPRLRNHKGERKRIETQLRALPQLRGFYKRFDLLDEIEQDTVVARGEAIYLAHFQNIKERSEGRARSQGIVITKICAILPTEWDSWSRHKLREMLRHVWSSINDIEIET